MKNQTLINEAKDERGAKLADCAFCIEPITDADWNAGEVADTPHGRAHDACWLDEVEAREFDADLFGRTMPDEIYD